MEQRIDERAALVVAAVAGLAATLSDASTDRLDRGRTPC